MWDYIYPDSQKDSIAVEKEQKKLIKLVNHIWAASAETEYKVIVH